MRELWAEFDVYKKIALFGSDIARLLEEERRAKDDYQRKQKEQERKQKQQEVRDLISAFIRNGRWGPQIVDDEAMRQMMLAQLLPADAICEGRSTQCKDYAKGKTGLQWWYYKGNVKEQQGKFQQFLAERVEWMASVLSLVKPNDQENTVAPILPNLTLFPPGSCAIQLTFTLRKPYISKDDTDFYILDNPLKKEHVFKVPYVAPSQWKGALRATMTKDLAAWWQSLPGHARQKREVRKQFVQRRLQITRLFGNEKGVLVDDFQFEAYLDHVVEDERLNRWYRRALRCLYAPTGFLAGRLHFYPTFFDKIGLEVINPHPRDTGAGKNPIYFEAVPAGTKGVFTLLYVPLGAGPTDETACAQDLAAVACGVQAMLTVYGFGAKTSSGYGVADTLVALSYGYWSPAIHKYFTLELSQ